MKHMREEKSESAASKKTIAAAIAKKYVIITLGCIIYAAGISLFISPAGLSSGGMTGISIILNFFVSSVPQGIWYLILNVPMLILGLVFFGWGFLVSTGYATVLSSLLMTFFKMIMTACNAELPLGGDDIIINCVIGGALFGVGMGLIFRMGSSTAGTDVIVKLLRRKFRHLKTGAISFCTDMLIVLCSFFMYMDISNLFYTALSTVVFTMVFDWVLYGGNSAKTVFIITSQEKCETLRNRILKDVDTGATLVNVEGAYSGTEKVMLMCVVKPFMYPALRDVVKEEDRNAFMIVSSAKEIYGNGYKDQNAEEI